jgi:hypothetical protein
MSQRNRYEDNLQRGIVKYLRIMERQRRLAALWFHVPNGGGRNSIEASIFKGLGVTAGVADLVFLWGDAARVCERLVQAAQGAMALLNHIGADVPVFIPTLGNVAMDLEAALAAVAVVPGLIGGSACVEVKSLDGRLSPAQVEFQASCAQRGIPYEVVRDINEAEKVLQRLGIVRPFDEVSR